MIVFVCGVLWGVIFFMGFFWIFIFVVFLFGVIYGVYLIYLKVDVEEFGGDGVFL